MSLASFVFSESGYCQNPTFEILAPKRDPPHRVSGNTSKFTSILRHLPQLQIELTRGQRRRQGPSTDHSRREATQLTAQMTLVRLKKSQTKELASFPGLSLECPLLQLP